MKTSKPLALRLRESCAVDAKTGCWMWFKMLDRDGYPRMKTGSHRDRTRKHSGAHRISYETFIGPIPEGLVIDHICRNRACINPRHLRVVSPRRNSIENSVATPAINAAKTHCKRGHPLIGENLWVNSHGERQCRTCERMRGRNREAKRRKLAGIVAVGKGGLRKLQTHCKNGHKFTPENTYTRINPSTGYAMRKCKACILASNAKRRKH